MRKFRYENNYGEVIEFNTGDYIADAKELSNYSWTYTKTNSIISNVRKGINKRKLRVLAHGGMESANNLKNVIEKDVVNENQGKIILGDWYLRGYFTECKLKKTDEKSVFMYELTFVSDDDVWIKEKTIKHRTWEEATSDSGLGYPYDYPYDYVTPMESGVIVNDSYAGADFQMIIYGHVENPVVSIAGNEYAVDCEIQDSEYLIIDSAKKTIQKRDLVGNYQNYFSYRNNSNGYIFQKIPSGTSSARTNTMFNYDITLFEKRSEPEWI